MLIYNDLEHSYKRDGIRYTSVTQKISELKPKEDWVKIATAYVKKRSNKEILKDIASKWELSEDDIVKKFGKGDSIKFTSELVQHIWNKAGVRATTGGSFWHNYKEVKDGKLDNTVYTPLIKGEKYSFDLNKLEPNKTYLELLLYNHRARIAGQSDKAIIKENSSIIRDYKVVNKELTPEVPAYWNKSLRRKVQKKFKRLNIPYNSYWEYAIQLSMYGYMLEVYGFPPEKLIIDQIKTKWVNEKDLNGEFVIDRDDEIGKVRIVTEEIEVELPYLKEVKTLFI